MAVKKHTWLPPPRVEDGGGRSAAPGARSVKKAGSSAAEAFTWPWTTSDPAAVSRASVDPRALGPGRQPRGRAKPSAMVWRAADLGAARPHLLDPDAGAPRERR